MENAAWCQATSPTSEPRKCLILQGYILAGDRPDNTHYPRSGAPDARRISRRDAGLGRRELAAVLERLAEQPFSGAAWPDPDLAGVGRVLLVRSRYHAYYVVDEAAELVTVLAVWHSARGVGPPLA